MPWFTKNGTRYYVWRRTSFGQVIRDRFGAGFKGEQAAAEDATRRAQEEAERQDLREEFQRWQDQQKPLDQLTKTTDFLTRTALVLSG